MALGTYTPKQGDIVGYQFKSEDYAHSGLVVRTYGFGFFVTNPMMHDGPERFVQYADLSDLYDVYGYNLPSTIHPNPDAFLRSNGL